MGNCWGYKEPPTVPSHVLPPGSEVPVRMPSMPTKDIVYDYHTGDFKSQHPGKTKAKKWLQKAKNSAKLSRQARQQPKPVESVIYPPVPPIAPKTPEKTSKPTATPIFVPDDTFQDPAYIRKMAQKYDMPEAEVKEAARIAESADFMDLLCFFFCMHGGSVEQRSGDLWMMGDQTKQAIAAWKPSPGTADASKVFTKEERARQERAWRMMQTEESMAAVTNGLQASGNADDEFGMQEVDEDEIKEREAERIEASIQGMPLHEVLASFGVGEYSKQGIQTTLHPTIGMMNADVLQKAQRNAKYDIAMRLWENAHGK